MISMGYFFSGGFLASCNAAFGRGVGVWVWVGSAAALRLGDKHRIFVNRLVAVNYFQPPLVILEKFSLSDFISGFSPL